MSDRIQVTMKGGVADVRMVRTDKMNALDPAMFAALVETGERLKNDPSVRVVVLSGEGRAFCAGLDMGNFSRMADGTRSESGSGESLVTPKRTATLGANHAQQAVLVWHEMPVPVIAAIHGVAFGGGFQLALGPDIRFVAPDTKMSIMEIKWGLVPDMGGFVLMPELAREDVIRELMFSGRIFSGEEALQYGFATRVCADPYAEALALAQEIASKNPDAIRASKRLSALARKADARTVLEAESSEQTALIGSPNQVEAIRANMEKRAPVFTDAKPVAVAAE